MKRTMVHLTALLTVAAAVAAIAPLGRSAPSTHENDEWLMFERRRVAGDAGTTQIYVRRVGHLDPGEIARDEKVTHMPGGAFNPTPERAAGSGWIVFNHPPADELTRESGLFVTGRVGPRGYVARPIETTCGARCLEEFAPAVSPDGSKLAFLAAYGPLDGDAADHVDLVVTDRDGGNRRVLRSSSWVRDGGEPTYAPSWSPDGRRLAFVVRYRAGGSTLYVIDADGTGLRRVTGRSLDTRSPARPAWAPAGNRIAIDLARTSDGDPEIHTIGADGRRLTRVTRSPYRTGAWAPAWSKRGGQIAFVRWDPVWEQSDIWIMRSDGTAQRRVARTRQNEGNPAWSGG